MGNQEQGVASRQGARPQPGTSVSHTPSSTHFTLVFNGDIRKFDRNPLQTNTPFGRPIAAGMGDAFAEFDEFCETRDDLLETLRRVDHTLAVHGHVDADTDLHETIRAAICAHRAHARELTPRDPSNV